MLYVRNLLCYLEILYNVSVLVILVLAFCLFFSLLIFCLLVYFAYKTPIPLNIVANVIIQ